MPPPVLQEAIYGETHNRLSTNCFEIQRLFFYCSYIQKFILKKFKKKAPNKNWTLL